MKIPSSIVPGILSLCGRVTWQQAEKAGAEFFPQAMARHGHASGARQL